MEKLDIINEFLTCDAMKELHDEPSLVHDDYSKPAIIKSATPVPVKLPYMVNKRILGNNRKIRKLMFESMKKYGMAKNLSRYVKPEGDQSYHYDTTSLGHLAQAFTYKIAAPKRASN